MTLIQVSDSLCTKKSKNEYNLENSKYLCAVIWGRKILT
jgi:hypothetical protein